MGVQSHANACVVKIISNRRPVLITFAKETLAMKIFLLIIAAAASSGIVNPIEAVHEDMLKQHNDFRKEHNANDLSIDDELMISAQAWADTLAATNSFEHSTPFDLNGVCVGENLFFSTEDESSAIDATREWYCEVDDYKRNPNVWTDAVGHFTQLVWKDTERVGFGIARGSDGWTRVVAQYQPCGNFNFNGPMGARANVDMADSKLFS